MSYLKNIAIAGASGVIGTPIIDHLLKAGKHNITALTRSGSKAKFPDNVKAAEVDYEDKASLASALAGQDVLLICLSVATPIAVEKRLMEAAAEAEVRWIVPNEWSPDITSDPNIAKDIGISAKFLEMRKYVQDLGLSWTSQCSSFWYEHSLVSPQCFGFELDKKRATFFDEGTARVTASTWEQCGRAIAALFGLPVASEGDGKPCLMDWKNRMHYCGSFLVSQRDMLNSWLRVTGEHEADWTIEYEPAQERFQRGQRMLEAGDMFGGPLITYGRLFQRDRSGDLSDKSENTKLGLPREDLDEATMRAVKMYEDGYIYNPFK